MKTKFNLRVLFKTNKILLITVLVAFFLPSKNNGFLFGGLPIDSYRKFFLGTILILLVIFFIKHSHIHKLFHYLLLSLAIFLIIIKTLSFAQPNQSFMSCYKILGLQEFNFTEPESCEKSWDLPFSKNMTRYDSEINFGSATDNLFLVEGFRDSNWNLSAVNSLKYNFYSEDQPNQNRLPFKVNWKGLVMSEKSFSIRYVGEGSILALGQSIDLPKSYDKPNTVKLNHAGEPFLIDISFEWNPLEINDGQFASIRFSDEERSTTVIFKNYFQHLQSIIEVLLLIGIFFILLFYFLITILTREKSNKYLYLRILILGSYTVLLFVLTSSGFLRRNEAFAGAAMFVGNLNIYPLIFFILFIFIFFNFYSFPKILALPFNLLAVLLTSIFISQDAFPKGGKTVIYRNPGDDFLTYVSYAREILIRGNLRAGEDVFVYSPGIRYWLAMNHLLFGDSDRMIFLLSIFILLLSLTFMLYLVASNLKLLAPVSNYRLFLVLTSFALLTLFVGLNSFFYAGFTLLSEYPTWPIIIVLISYLFTKLSRNSFYFVSLLCGLLPFFRANQIIAAGLILFLFNLKFFFQEIRHSQQYNLLNVYGMSLFLFFLPTISIILHNFYYGRVFEPLQTSLPLPVNFPLRISDILRINKEQVVQQAFWDQLSGVLVINQFIQMAPLIHTIQFLYLFAFIFLIFKFFNKKSDFFLALLIPLFFLIPHIFVQVFVYYPRHIIAGYLTMVIVLIHILSLFARGKSNFIIIKSNKKILQ